MKLTLGSVRQKHYKLVGVPSSTQHRRWRPRTRKQTVLTVLAVVAIVAIPLAIVALSDDECVYEGGVQVNNDAIGDSPSLHHYIVAGAKSCKEHNARVKTIKEGFADNAKVLLMCVAHYGDEKCNQYDLTSTIALEPGETLLVVYVEGEARRRRLQSAAVNASTWTSYTSKKTVEAVNDFLDLDKNPENLCEVLLCGTGVSICSDIAILSPGECEAAGETWMPSVLDSNPGRCTKADKASSNVCDWREDQDGNINCTGERFCDGDEWTAEEKQCRPHWCTTVNATVIEQEGATESCKEACEI